jgi:hypothetical protein
MAKIVITFTKTEVENLIAEVVREKFNMELTKEK